MLGDNNKLNKSKNEIMFLLDRIDNDLSRIDDEESPTSKKNKSFVQFK